MSEQTERTNQASPIQLEQATQRGDVANSQELGASLQNIGGLLVLLVTAGGLGAWLISWTRTHWSNQPLKLDEVVATAQGGLYELALQLLPMLLLLMLITCVVYWIQSGFVLQPDRVLPRLERLSPTRFAEQGVLRKSMMALFALPKMLLGIGLAAMLIWWQRDRFFELALLPVEKILENGFGVLLLTAFQVALMLLAFGLLDYGVEWLARNQRLQMSDQQLRDEQRMQEGDPTVIARQRQRQQELSNSRSRRG